MYAIENDIELFSSQIGISSNELIRQSLLYFVWNKLKDVKTELFMLQKKYNVASVFEFEELYQLGTIDETNTFEDYQKFDRLTYELEIFEKFIKQLL